jgi:hypothetical protein
MAQKGNAREPKILPYGRKERYLPRCWWFGYNVIGNTD